MDSDENVTFRRARTQLDLETTKHDSDISSGELIDGSASSLPDLSIDCNNEQVNNLIQKVDQLQNLLNSANVEIEQLSLENKDLRKNNYELAKKNVIYKKLSHSPVKVKSPTPTTKKPVKSQQTIKMQKQTQTDSMSPKKLECKESKNTRAQKQTQTDAIEPQSLGNKKTNIKHRETQTIMQTESSTVKRINVQTQTSNFLRTYQQQATYQIRNIAVNTQQQKVIHQSLKYKPKICLISSNKQNKVLTIAQDIISPNSSLCHYLTPNSCIQQQLSGLQAKLIDFTMEDYCIILIGDEDFVEGNKLTEIVNYIKQTLQNVTHTNVVICTPTYHYGFESKNINQRIQNFNNLLYKDINSYKYAYLIDTNRHLAYDYSMFHKPSGTISNAGLRTVFRDLAITIEKIEKMKNDRDSSRSTVTNVENIETEMESQFFL